MPLPHELTVNMVHTDVFGLINNAKLLADSFAEQAGFLCVVPDLFHGKALAEGLMEKGLFITDIGVEAPTSFGGKVWRAMRKSRAPLAR